MKYLLMLTPLLFVLTTSIANAADFYYCDCQSGASSQCRQGTDSNSGRSQSAARKTFTNAASTFRNFNAGDSIKFCRGGSFTANAEIKWVNNKCTAANNCTVSTYDLPGQQDSELPRPIITQRSNNNLFSLDDTANADHEEGYSFSDLDLRCTGCQESGSGMGFFLYNDVDYVTIDNIKFDGFRIGIYLAGSNATNPGSNGKLDNITLTNLRIVNSKRQGILGGANNLVISNSYFDNNGSGSNRDHNLYISKGGDNIVIKGNELYRSSLDSSGKCGGNPIVVHGTVNNLLIEGNIVREYMGKATNGCWGIAVDTGYTAAESFTNVTIRGNKVINVGNIAIGVASCDTCTIENNVILQEQSFSFTAIKAPDRNRASNDKALNKVIIRNNSIYTSSNGTGIMLGDEGRQHIVVSNAIYYTGSGRYTCFNLGLNASAYTAVNNNTCHFPNATTQSEWEAGSGTNPSPLDAWQGRSGFGLNSQQVDPEFNEPTLPLVNLSPKLTTSPISNSGHSNLSAIKDIRGKRRDSQPDAGAYEFGMYNPPSKTKIFLK